MIQLVIFDLDGTLLNTIADLAESTNYALNQHHFPTHPTESYRFFVGNGINKLFERALPEGEKKAENIANIRKSFLAYYSEHNMDRSEPYPGIPGLLQSLHERGIQLAVASNKYHEATCILVKHYFPDIPFAAVFGQREGITPKPDPTIVHDILSATEIEATDTLYVGDSGVDMQTANNSGVTACGVTWGFRPRTELEQFHPHHIVDHPEDILQIVG